MAEKPAIRAAVDIGGTFTDTVLMNDAGTILATCKTPTTPANPTLGALAGVEHALKDAGAGIGQVTAFIHGTTLATNALIERQGARVATITNDGFRDILEIAYERRYSQYDINIEKPDLIVPRSRAFTIRGRMDAQGRELIPLDETAIPDLVGELHSCRAEAVAICLLHAYAKPAHEERLRDLLAAELPDVTISISSQVSPEAREFDRLCTTIANAYIQPLMARYLSDFARQFAAARAGMPGPDDDGWRWDDYAGDSRAIADPAGRIRSGRRGDPGRAHRGDRRSVRGFIFRYGRHHCQALSDRRLPAAKAPGVSKSPVPSGLSRGRACPCASPCWR